MKKIILFTFIIIFFTTSCERSEYSCNTDISNEITSIESISSCTNTINEMSIINSSEFIIIKTADEYNANVISACNPNIDFTKFNLIIGNIGSEFQITSLNYKLIKSCEPNFYKLYITINKDVNILNNKANTFHILIPKSEEVQFLKIIHLSN